MSAFGLRQGFSLDVSEILMCGARAKQGKTGLELRSCVIGYDVEVEMVKASIL